MRQNAQRFGRQQVLPAAQHQSAAGGEQQDGQKGEAHMGVFDDQIGIHGQEPGEAPEAPTPAMVHGGGGDL